MPPSARVFISYAHERETAAHGERVLAFANRLRADGIESRIDQYVVAPAKGWRLWMEDEIEAADFVLTVATETYERRRRGREEPGTGLGVRWEGAVIGQELYESALVNDRFIPIVFERSAMVHVPSFLRDHPIYVVGEDEGYEALRRRLTKQPSVEPPPVGPVRELAPKSAPEFRTTPFQGSAGELSAMGAQVQQEVAPAKPHLGRRSVALATGWFGIMAIYGGALTALLFALTSRLVPAEELFPRLPDGVLWTVAGLPLLAALSLHAAPAWRRTRTARRLADWSVRPQPITDVRPFRISPYEDTPEDRARYDRADGAHQAVLSWLQRAPQTTLYLTGVSGSGKSSLLSAYVLPALRGGSPPAHPLVVRSYDDPLARLAEQLQSVDAGSPSGVTADPASLRSRLQAAAAAAGSLLLVFDQFEQFLIVHEGDERRLSALRELIISLAGQAVPGIRVLLVLRSDYQPMLQSFLRGAALPALELDRNWKQIDVFRERQAREFLQRGLDLGPELMDEVFRQIAEVEGTPGLVRPITINMFGLVLDSKALPGGTLLAKHGKRGGLLLEYLRRSLAQATLRHHGPAILRRMITHRRVAVPRNVAALAEETGFPPDVVTGSLLELATNGLTRRIDSEQDVWEISHDFVAEYLDAILRPGRRWLQQGLRAAAAIVAVAGWLVVFLPLATKQTETTAQDEPEATAGDEYQSPTGEEVFFSREDLKQALIPFETYWTKIGFQRRGWWPQILVSATERDNSYYQFSNNTIVLGAGLADDTDIQHHHYTHFVLYDSNPTLAQVPARALPDIELGLADYFACSFASDPLFAEKSVALFSKFYQPSLRRLDNDRRFGEIINSKDPRFTAPQLAGEVWGGAFWELRTAAGPHVTDRLLFLTWSEARPNDFLGPYGSRFVSALRDRATSLDPSGDLSHDVADVFRRRGISVATTSEPRREPSPRNAP